MRWTAAFSCHPELRCLQDGTLLPRAPLKTLADLQTFLDCVHSKHGLLRPFFQYKDYPLTDPRDLLPSFEPCLYEYHNLPGFSMVALDRMLDYFNEIFQFDLLHSCQENTTFNTENSCPLEIPDLRQNQNTILHHLEKERREAFKAVTAERPVTELSTYSSLIDFLGQMDRAHVISKNSIGSFFLSGVYASFPSDLDTELKRFGLRAGKFKPNNSQLYEKNRDFMYQFLMELYGYPISSERKTSAAMFARRLHKIGERFLIKILSQSDRTLTTLASLKPGARYPHVSKIALVPFESRSKEIILQLDKDGFFVDSKRRVLLIRVIYRQHKFNANNVRQERALSVIRQEIIHPLDGRICTSVNILKDSYSMSLKLNDIVRGEFSGRVLYKNGEVVENTETHAKRLKFLYAWLNKHQRRMIGYSEEFYLEIAHVLDGYLLGPDQPEEFSTLRELRQEVLSISSYIRQARNIKVLEDLSQRTYKGKKINSLDALKQSLALLTDLKFELINYFDTLAFKAVYFAEEILNDRYLVKKYTESPPDKLTPYGQKVLKLYRRLVSLVDELKAIRKTKADS